GDMGCHTANMPYRGLRLDAPEAIIAEAAEINPETYPAWAHITSFYPARGPLVPCALHWYEGERDGKRMLPATELFGTLLPKGEEPTSSGSLLIGDKGVLYSPNDYGSQIRLAPEKDFTGIQTTKPEKLPLAVDGDKECDAYHKKEW